MKMGVRRFAGALGALVVLATLVPGQVLANHGFYHGYCKDGVPVLTEPPPDELKDHYQPACLGDMLIAVANDPLVSTPDSGVKEQPEDFYAWAYIFLNGHKMMNPYRDVSPYVTKSTGRTLIPIRMVVEGMGGTAEWSGSNAQVTIRLNGKYMVMRIGESAAEANGRTVTLDQPPLLWKDRTMVPLRVIMEAFGADVGWVPNDARVDINIAGVTCAPGYCLQ